MDFSRLGGQSSFLSQTCRPLKTSAMEEEEALSKPAEKSSYQLRGFLRAQSAHPLRKPEQQKASKPSSDAPKNRPKTALGRSRSTAASRRVPRLRKPTLTSSREMVNGVPVPRRKSVDGDEIAGPAEVATLITELDLTLDVGDQGQVAREETDGMVGKSQTYHRRRDHPTLDTWLAGSPHDSDEYDTDLEEKAEFLLELDKPLTPVQRDATGLQAYEEMCRKEGFVPVSFLKRHLGKRNIRMRHHYLGGKATKPVAAAFRRNTVTENLDLGDNYVQSCGAYYLAQMLKENMFIVSLNLSCNCIESSGVRALCDMLEVNTTLKSLNLSGNQLVDSDAKHFVDAMKNNHTLISLDLSHNEFGELGGEYLGGAIAMSEGLTDIDLSWNCIRKKGAAAIARALKVNASLEVLDVGWNGFGIEGATALQEALQVNTTLKVLDITNNRLNQAAAEKLALGIRKNFGLECLNINQNPMGDEGIQVVLKNVELHQTLKLLSMENCWEMALSKANYQKIRDLENNKDLIVLHGGVGGYQRITVFASVLRLFSRFLQQHRAQLEDVFQQQDKERTGDLTTEELKTCLKLSGLRLTNRQLDILMDEIDHTHSGSVAYRDILSGKAIASYQRRHPPHEYVSAQPGEYAMLVSSMGRQLTVS